MSFHLYNSFTEDLIDVEFNRITLLMLSKILINKDNKEIEELFAFSPDIVEIFSGIIISHYVDEIEYWLHSYIIFNLL